MGLAGVSRVSYNSESIHVLDVSILLLLIVFYIIADFNLISVKNESSRQVGRNVVSRRTALVVAYD